MNKPAVETLPPAPAADPLSGSHASLRENSPRLRRGIRIGLLTGGDDKPYALGLASTLLAQGVSLDFIGSDIVDGPVLHDNPRVNFLNLRGTSERMWALPGNYFECWLTTGV